MAINVWPPRLQAALSRTPKQVCFNVSGLEAMPSGQDGDTRVLVLIRRAAASAIDRPRLPERDLTFWPSSISATRKHHRSINAMKRQPTKSHAAGTASSTAKVFSRRSTAQAIRASLFAKATTTTL